MTFILGIFNFYVIVYLVIGFEKSLAQKPLIHAGFKCLVLFCYAFTQTATYNKYLEQTDANKVISFGCFPHNKCGRNITSYEFQTQFWFFLNVSNDNILSTIYRNNKGNIWCTSAERLRNKSFLVLIYAKAHWPTEEESKLGWVVFILQWVKGGKRLQFLGVRRNTCRKSWAGPIHFSAKWLFVFLLFVMAKWGTFITHDLLLHLYFTFSTFLLHWMLTETNFPPSDCRRSSWLRRLFWTSLVINGRSMKQNKEN